jgi:diguanylate cyclase
VHVCERLQLALTKQPLVDHGQEITMTFSAGVSVHADEDTDASLLKRADQALYEAKNAGCNRVLAA